MQTRPQLAALLGSGLFLAGWERAHACATCFGVSDSKLAQGMNWGILSLLFVIGSVLAAVALFFIYIIRRSARLADVPGETDSAAAAAGGVEREVVETLN